jgi:hypothetical protein
MQPKVADMAAYKTAFDARNEARDLVTEHHLKTIATYFEAVAGRSINVLGTTGYDLRHDIVKGTTHCVPAEPTDYKVMRTEVSGGGGECEGRPDVDMYEVQIATGDPAVEASGGQSTVDALQSYRDIQFSARGNVLCGAWTSCGCQGSFSCAFRALRDEG